MSLQGSIAEDVPDPTVDEHGEHGRSRHKDDIPSFTHGTMTRLDIMKTWIKACDEHHDSCCRISKADANIWPIWIIDVVDECIVEGDIADRYLTLSYVWGGVQTLQATTSNIERLKQPGSLASDQLVLPKTIRQALEITRLLGERYIWIDQLSILQDDYEHKQTQIEHMAEIYANSYLTLLAVTGDTADHGLVHDINQTMNQTSFNLDWRSVLSEAQNYIQYSSTWTRRGWTFQENVFARRVVYFLEFVSDYDGSGHDCPRCSFWQCQQDEWDELGVVTHEKDKLPNTCPGRVDVLQHRRTCPDFSQYIRLVDSYTSRDFTHDSDVVPAFAGVETLTAKSFRGGVLYGLPVLFFDVALLWNPDRISSMRKLDAAVNKSNRPPSWSWMTWHGDLDLFFWSFASSITNFRVSSTISISPVAQWYYFGAGGALVAIASDYCKYKHFAQDDKSTPPSEWIRIREAPPYSHSEMSEEHYYVTKDAPVPFRFPIPLANQSNPEMPTPSSNRIACQTERAHFYICGLSTDRRGRTYSPILDAEEVYSGIIPLSRNALESCFSTTDADVAIRIQLIAVSTGSIEGYDDLYLGYFQESSRPEHRNVGGIYEFYNVLWIEWTGGIAYRKGLGRVNKAAWEAADRELIDVVLG